MHPLLERGLWLRDRDLKRWGKPGGILFALLGLLCFGGSIAGHRMAGRIRTSLEKSHQLDGRLAGSLPESKAKSAITKSFDTNHAISLQLASSMERANAWFMGSAGLLALSAALYAWRAGELASKLSDSPGSDSLSLQGGTQQSE